eukprot:SAG25_NODE_53_length_18703_cov_126.779104_14_plen_88_part_00
MDGGHRRVLVAGRNMDEWLWISLTLPIASSAWSKKNSTPSIVNSMPKAVRPKPILRLSLVHAIVGAGGVGNSAGAGRAGAGATRRCE